MNLASAEMLQLQREAATRMIIHLLQKLRIRGTTVGHALHDVVQALNDAYFELQYGDNG